MNLMLPDTGLLFWMTVIFLIVLFILAKFFKTLCPEVNQFTDMRNA